MSDEKPILRRVNVFGVYRMRNSTNSKFRPKKNFKIQNEQFTLSLVCEYQMIKLI